MKSAISWACCKPLTTDCALFKMRTVTLYLSPGIETAPFITKQFYLGFQTEMLTFLTI